MNAFGDWFLQDEDGHVDSLSVRAGAVVRVSDSVDDFNRSWHEPGFVDAWFDTGLLAAAQDAGMARPGGQCYAFRIHPALGGSMDAANLVLLDIEVWQAFCSELHLQARKLPPGTRILGLECGEGVELRLVTESRPRSLLRRLSSLVTRKPES